MFQLAISLIAKQYYLSAAACISVPVLPLPHGKERTTMISVITTQFLKT